MQYNFILCKKQGLDRQQAAGSSWAWAGAGAVQEAVRGRQAGSNIFMVKNL